MHLHLFKLLVFTYNYLEMQHTTGVMEVLNAIQLYRYNGAFGALDWNTRNSIYIRYGTTGAA